jgi:hypothetical protein
MASARQHADPAPRSHCGAASAAPAVRTGVDSRAKMPTGAAVTAGQIGQNCFADEKHRESPEPFRHLRRLMGNPLRGQAGFRGG